MSEKHLTELPWKTLVVKQGVKDLGLQKALVAYAKLDATQEAEKVLETLEEISELALKLKKTLAAKDEVVAYLDEVVKEVKKTTPALEARIKPAEAKASPPATPGEKAAAKPGAMDEDQDEAAAAEFKKDLQKQMVSALAQVKMRAPGQLEPGEEPKPQLKFMAYLAGQSSAVVVALKVGAATKKVLPDIAGGVSGGKYILGDCVFEKNLHTFVVEQNPGGLAKTLARALRAETGQKYKVRVRTLDGAEEADEGADLEGVEAGVEANDPANAVGATELPQGSADDPLRAQWLRLKLSLLPDIKQALATNPTNKTLIAKGVGEANQHEKNENFPGAIAAFEALRPLLRPAPAVRTIGAADFTARLKTLAPRLASGARNAEVARLTAQMQALAKSQDFAGAMALLLQIAAILDAGASPGSDRFPALWAAAKQGWFDASEAVDAQIDKLQQALKGLDDPELQAIAEFGLNALTRNHKVPLLAAIRDIDGANATTRAALAKKARAIVDRFGDHVSTDERITACDENPFGVSVGIQARIGPALAALSSALATA